MGEEFTLDNIASSSDIEELFGDAVETKQSTPTDDGVENNNNNIVAEDLTADDLFGNDSESVGNKEENNNSGEPAQKSGSASPHVYSSIAAALKKDGSLTAVDDDFIKNINDSQGFSDAIEKEIASRFDERQKRIDDALNYNVEPSEINKYENMISYLESIDEEKIKDESDEGINLRSRIMYQDYINNGVSDDKARKLIKLSFDNNTDIEDTINALEGNKEFFNKEYNRLVESAKKETEKANEKKKQQEETLKNSIFNDKELISGLGNLDKSTRQKIYDNISKPSIKDSSTGKYYTAVQNYQKENPVEFTKAIGILYTLTDGFKSIENLIKTETKRIKKESLDSLEKVLSNTPRNSDGSLNLVGGFNDDDSYIGTGWTLDIRNK